MNKWIVLAAGWFLLSPSIANRKAPLKYWDTWGMYAKRAECAEQKTLHRDRIPPDSGSIDVQLRAALKAAQCIRTDDPQLN